MRVSRDGTTAPPPQTRKNGQVGPSGKIIAYSPRRLRTFRAQLLRWYDTNKRDLPWRVTKDPYLIWLSEIMLQQTRVAVVKEYYPSFVKRFPRVAVLASARISSVLAVWSGLGYYRRARKMHAAAREIVRDRGGQFPRTATELKRLPGIGRYTAAAVASIAFGEPVPVVDGNVERVLTRLFGRKLETGAAWELAGQVLDPTRPGDFNQAMMELGATVCLPRQPLCDSCPMHGWCTARGEFGHRISERRKRATLRYCLAARNGSVFLVRRPTDASLMAGMWELPELPPGLPFDGTTGFKLRHAVTITDFSVEVVPGEPPRSSPGKWIARSRLPALPLTGLTRKIFRHAGII
jgi:A/G-specific adenine glycosylase